MTYDEFSIECHDGGATDLGIFYSHLFIQDEVLRNKGTGSKSVFYFKNKDLRPGTVCGKIHDGLTATTFTVASNGKVNLQITTDCMSSNDCVGFCNHEKGMMVLNWKENPGDIYVKVSYEYPNESKND